MGSQYWRAESSVESPCERKSLAIGSSCNCQPVVHLQPAGSQFPLLFNVCPFNVSAERFNQYLLLALVSWNVPPLLLSRALSLHQSASPLLSPYKLTLRIMQNQPVNRGAKSPYPMGSYFYVCGGDKFEGCCSTDPCLLPDCPRGPLKRDDNENLPVESSTSSNKGSSNSGSPKTETPEPDEPKETTKASPSPSETKTDSGITHTIPNSSIVTITKHTVVFSEAPPSSTTSIPETSNGTAPGTTCSDCNEPSQTSNSDEDASNEVGVTPGAIAGIAAGGAIILALVVIIWVVARRRKRERQSSGVSDEDTAGGSRVDGYEKVTPHTTGTEGVGDPFAPFGGELCFASYQEGRRGIWLTRQGEPINLTARILHTARLLKWTARVLPPSNCPPQASGKLQVLRHRRWML